MQNNFFRDERELWIASDRYMRGDITYEELKEVEKRHEKYIKQATSVPIKRPLILLKSSIVVIIIMIAILMSISIILLYKNVFPPLILIPLTYYLIRYILNDNFPQIRRHEKNKELVS